MSGAFLYVSAGFFCLGVAAALLFPFGFLGVVALLAAASILLAAALLMRQPKLMLGVVALVCFALGALRADVALANIANETLPNYIGDKVEVSGRVAGDPDMRDTSVHVTLADLSINNEPVSGELLVLLNSGTALSYNDTISVSGKITAPQAFQTDTGHTFDYPGYLRAQGIGAQMSHATLVSDSPSGFTILGALFGMKHAFEYSLDNLFPNPDNALLQGVLLGEKHGISQQLTDAFVRSGLVHIVVLSGYNIAVVSEAMFRALSFLPRTMSLGVGGIAMILFAFMTGAGAATVRALVMGLIGLLARYLRRPSVALRSLVVAATAMVLWNPEALLYDTSFILSVLATLGLIMLAPWVEWRLARIRLFRKPQMLGTRSIVASTLAVEIFVVPALLYFSGVLSLLSLPANALVLPLIPAAMLFGFIAGTLGLVSSLLGSIPAFIADILLKYILLVVGVIASIPMGALVVSQFPPWWLAVLYVPLTWFAVSKYRKTIDIHFK